MLAVYDQNQNQLGVLDNAYNVSVERKANEIYHSSFSLPLNPNNLSLSFYERFNPNFVANFPKELRSGLLSKLSEANVIPYTEEDWREFSLIRKCLSKYHTIN